MTCDELRDEYDAFALGVAEDPERAEIDEHLTRACPTCTHGVREAAAVVAAISSLARPAKPPRMLRRRVLGMVGASSARSRFGFWLPWGLAAVLALVLASVIIPARRESAAAGRFEEALAILNDPSAKDVSFGEPAKPARGRVFVSPRRGIVLVAANLPSIAANRIFEMWVIPQSGNPIPAGTFRGDREGTAVYVHSGPVQTAAAVAVTIEPSGGSPQPTTTPFIVSRLFMQLLAFGGAPESARLIEVLEGAGLSGVLYEDVNDPSGIGLLTWSPDPDHFVLRVRPLLNREIFAELSLKPEYTMMGRTYSLGYEPNLEEWLVDRPGKIVTDREWSWHVWYPLRRRGEFNSMAQEEQTAVLREHGRIGHSFGEAGLAHDIRLACFGLDKNDNDFIIGLIGKELYPLSACVQAMRKTKQTSFHMQEMGPFFIGKAVWQKNRP